ncbi:MAG: MFS transporter [Gammaproteobacteria bacterium]
MYQFDLQRIAGLHRTNPSVIGANVYLLGLTSLITDISSEMTGAILPIYLVIGLHLTPLQFGFIDGLYQGAAVLVRLASGIFADRWRRNREIAAFGYGLSAFCKLGLVLAGNAAIVLSGVVLLDRIGKGIRTAPRDALISLSSSPSHHGLAFGVHRALDTAGALLGPLVAFALLALLPEAYDAIFVCSFFVALIGLSVLLLFVQNPVDTESSPVSKSVSIGAAIGLLGNRPFRSIVFIGTILGVATVADSFIYLGLRRELELDLRLFPLLYAGTSVAFLTLAIPAGRLADRIGRGRVFLFGYAMFLVACLVLLAPDTGSFKPIVCLALLGAHYACTDGVLMAMASGNLPSDMRASGLALLSTATGLARFCGSLLFGAVWNWRDFESALSLFVLGLSAAMMIAAFTLFVVQRSTKNESTVSE